MPTFQRNKKKRQGGSKPAIFIEGGRHTQTSRIIFVLIFLSTFIIPGIHAREWISPATVTYVMNELVTNPQHESLLDMFDFFILPVANPDGLVICEVSIN